jgi:CubicO group peptidase (beta-lactamase class C family)
MDFVLPAIDVAASGLGHPALDRLCAIVEGHIAAGRYPGAQLAVARHGRLVLARSFGAARLEPHRLKATDDLLWRLYSSTKVLVAAGIWKLVEDGALTFQDRVADHLPEFAKHGKRDITFVQLLSHQGGFPSALNPIAREAWTDHGLMRHLVGDITLEWTPGSKVHYHQRSAHWVAAAVIEAVAGLDFRAFLRDRVLAPIGLAHELYVGLPANENARTADVHLPLSDGKGHQREELENSAEYRAAGVPGTGAIGSARGMAAFYQMMLNGGSLNGVQLFSPRLIHFVTRNFTADRTDHHMGMPMHRGLGPHSRGQSESIRGLGSFAPPDTYGHGGVGTSYCWADPQSGVSFAYLSNSRLPDPWHSRRLDVLSNCVHAAINRV